MLSIRIQLVHLHWAYAYESYVYAQHALMNCRRMLSICVVKNTSKSYRAYTYAEHTLTNCMRMLSIRVEIVHVRSVPREPSCQASSHIFHDVWEGWDSQIHAIDVFWIIFKRWNSWEHFFLTKKLLIIKNLKIVNYVNLNLKIKKFTKVSKSENDCPTTHLRFEW